MASGVEQDDADFRATITNEDELLNTTFEDGSPASNVEQALLNVAEEFKAKHSDDMHYQIHHQVAQGIRVVLKDWREYKVDVGEDYMPNEPLDIIIHAQFLEHPPGVDAWQSR